MEKVNLVDMTERKNAKRKLKKTSTGKSKHDHQKIKEEKFNC